MRFLRKYFKRFGTREEEMLFKALKRRGLRVLNHVPDGHKHIDLAIPDAHINIEIDGNQHLTDSGQILSDLDREHGSDQLGYQTIHIPNVQIHLELDRVADALANAARTRISRYAAR